MQEAGATIETLMEFGKIKEAWDRISRCYLKVEGRQTPQTREALEQVTMERTELYICRPLELIRSPLLVRRAEVDDGIP